MTRDAYNKFCSNLPATTHVVQWGESDVWKVGGKVFAIASGDTTVPGITFKVTPLEFELLRQAQGVRPAPYLASRGMSWVQRYELPGLTDDELEHLLTESHRLVAKGLSKVLKISLSLEEWTNSGK